MDKSLVELVEMSNVVGAEPALTVGAGGNTSVKTPDGRYMYIKASGVALKDMTVTSGWRKLKLEPLLTVLGSPEASHKGKGSRDAAIDAAVLSACADSFGPEVKPSIESPFHAVLGRYVIHLHPVAVLGFACAKKGRERVGQIFRREDAKPLWVPYVRHGYSLAHKILQLTSRYEDTYGRSSNILILQKHGLIISAATRTGAAGLLRKAVALFEANLKPIVPVPFDRPGADVVEEASRVVRRVFSALTGNSVTVRHFIDQQIGSLAALPNIGRLCATGPVTPEELVYAAGPPLYLARLRRDELQAALKQRLGSQAPAPRTLIIDRLGLFTVATKDEHELIRQVATRNLLVRFFAAQNGGVLPLTARQCRWATETGG